MLQKVSDSNTTASDDVTGFQYIPPDFFPVQFLNVEQVMRGRDEHPVIVIHAPLEEDPVHVSKIHSERVK